MLDPNTWPKGTFNGTLSQNKGTFRKDENTYQILGRLSTGSMSIAFKCLDKLNREVVVKLKDYGDVDCIENNQHFLKQTKETYSRYVIYPTDGFFLEREKCEQICLVSEFCCCGGLDINNDFEITISLVLQFIFQSVIGLRKLHGLGFVHMDVKPDNFFIREFTQDKIVLVIGDLGIARKLNDNYNDTTILTNCYETNSKHGTEGYRDPLFIKHGLYRYKSDIWGLGVTLLEFISKTKISSLSFEKKSQQERFTMIDDIFKEKNSKEWTNIKIIVKGMLEEKISKRWNLSRILMAIFGKKNYRIIIEKSFGNNFRKLNKKFKQNESIIISCIMEDGLNLKYVNKKFHRYEHIIEKAVSQNGFAYEDIKSNLKYKNSIIRIAYENNPIRKLNKIRKEESLTPKINDNDRNDFSIMESYVSVDGLDLKLASDELKNNFEIVVKSVTNRGMSLQYASQNLQQNYEVIRKAISQNGMALQFVDEVLIDVELAFLSVRNNGLALQFVPFYLKGICFEQAIRSNAAAVNFISHELLDPFLFIQNSECLFKSELITVDYLKKVFKDQAIQEYLISILQNKLEKDISLEATKTCLDAQYQSGLIFFNELEYSKAYEWFLKSAEGGHLDAQFFLGVMFFNGIGISSNHSEAKKWFLNSAEQGHSEAQFLLGSYYGGKKKYPKAFEWFLKSAEQGNSHAQFMISLLFESGKGVPLQYAKAHEWYDLHTRHTKQDCSVRRKNAKIDYSKSFEWIIEIANNNYANIQCKLGQMYLNGYGFQQDNQSAYKWLLKSAKKGYSNAQFLIGEMYYSGKLDCSYDGIGMSSNHSEAYKWFLKSAEQGHPEAQFFLEVMSYNSSNHSEAYLGWLL